MKPLPEAPTVECQSVETPAARLFFTGPSLSNGPLPAFFYFSIAGDESLCLPPYNLPVAYLQGEPIRVFSLTLPAHGEGFDKFKAIEAWGHSFAQGDNVIELFLDRAQEALEFLSGQGILSIGRVAVGGLSRGAFIATHLAAREPRIGAVLGFAPLTDLAFSAHFSAIREREEVTSMALNKLVNQLTQTRVRFYIGNRDLLVSTRLAFDFIEALADASFHQGVRSPKAELVIAPAIGHKGHGTAPETFYSGARWIADFLL